MEAATRRHAITRVGHIEGYVPALRRKIEKDEGVIEVLRTHSQPCANCGQGSYVREEKTWLLGRLERGTVAFDETFSLIVVSCEVCGLTQMFDQRIVCQRQPS